MVIENMAKLAITWKKSTIGCPQDQRRTIVGLGLRRLNHTVEHDDSPSILGMINKVQHLVDVVPVPITEKLNTKRASRKKKS